jgi:type IV pilus assembly protein PilM
MAKFFGLDIGSANIKVLEAEPAKNGLRLVHYASVAVQGRKTAEVIRQAVKEAGIKAVEVNLCLPECDVYSRIVKTPKLSQAELASAIQYEAEQYVPVPLEEVELYHQILNPAEEESEPRSMEVLLIAVPKARVNRLMSLMDEVSLMPRSLETELMTLQRLFGDSTKSQLLLLFGQKTTDLIALDKNVPLIIYSIPNGGLSLTKTLATDLSLPEDEAEKYKQTYGLREDLLEGKVAKLLTPLINEVINQVKKAYAFIQQSGGHHLPEELIISGGGALLPGLSSYLAEQLNGEVKVANPLARFIQDGSIKKIAGSEVTPQLSTVVGLALKGLI